MSFHADTAVALLGGIYDQVSLLVKQGDGFQKQSHEIDSKLRETLRQIEQDARADWGPK